MKALHKNNINRGAKYVYLQLKQKLRVLEISGIFLFSFSLQENNANSKQLKQIRNEFHTYSSMILEVRYYATK